MLNKRLKIFIYNNLGEKIEEHNYSSLVKILLEIIDHNIQYENDQWNFIHGTQYPPLGLHWDNQLKDWIVDDDFKVIKNHEVNNFIKTFGI